MTAATVPVPATSRDYRVDFWRGVALVMIFVNHIPGNVFEDVTSRNFGFSDAAELFVFLAGFASAYAYASLFMAGHRLVASLKAWRRAGVLYMVHVLLTAIAFGLFSWAALVYGEGDVMQKIGLSSFLSMPLETMVGIPTLGHQLGYVNILPMYTAMLLMLPVHLLLASVSRWLMLSGAVALWLVAHDSGVDIPAHPLPGGWFFNPLSWQLIFAFGLFSGLSRKARGVAFPFNRWLYLAALAYALVAFVTIRFSLWWAWGELPFPVLVSGFDKTYVSVPRLLHILAICYLFANAAATSPFSSMKKDNPFVMLGRHSLPVFAVGTVLSLTGQIYKHGSPASFWTDLVMIGLGVAVLFALARYLDWWRVAQKVAPPKTADAMAGSAAGAIATPASDGPAALTADHRTAVEETA